MRRAERLFQIVQLIRGRRLSTAAFLAERLEVSERTVYRDVADLMTQGVPIEGEAGVGYRMHAGFDLPPMMFTNEEAQALVASVRVAQSRLDVALGRHAEVAPAKGKSSHKVIIVVAVNVLAAAAYFYMRYLTNATHHKVMTAASRAVVAAITSASASTAAATSKVAPVVEAPKSDVKLAVTASVNAASNSVPAKAAPVSLADSLMSVLSPSAKAETVQAPLPPARAADVAAAVPSARQTLKAKAPARRSIFDEDDDTQLTDAQQLSKLVATRFQNVVDMALKNPDVFGFGSGERADLATLGEPIVVYTISSDAQKSYQSGQPLKPLLQATNELVYPVMLDGSIRYMLPIKRVNGKYVATTGSRALAMVYEKIEQRWPAAEGYHPQLVVNPNMPNYYFTIPELPQQNLTDMGDMFQYNPTLSPASVILASWQ